MTINSAELKWQKLFGRKMTDDERKMFRYGYFFRAGEEADDEPDIRQQGY